MSTRILVTLLALALATSLSTAATPGDSRCYELRIYTAGPGKLPDLHARFRNHTMRLFEKHGMTNIAYWVPIENQEQKLVYMMSYPSKAARDESWKNFRADPAWQKVKADSDANGPLAVKVEEIFLQATDFSPEIAASNTTGKRIFELRTYHASDDNLDRLVDRARMNTDWLFRAYGIQYLGIWTMFPEQPESQNTLIYLLSHATVDSGKEAFRKLAEDKEWQNIKSASEEAAGGSLIRPDGIESIYLVPTDYSPTK